LENIGGTVVGRGAEIAPGLRIEAGSVVERHRSLAVQKQKRRKRFREFSAAAEASPV
jgi:hypothetical protein